MNLGPRFQSLLRAFRRRWWLPVLAVIALLMTLRPGEQAPPPPSASPRPVAAPPGIASPAPTAKAGAPAPAPSPVVDIFAVRTWEPPPPSVDATPLPPEAPPVPFRFLGRIAEPGKKPAFLLGANDRVLTVRVGDSVGTEWQLKGATGKALIFYYRPMKLRQTLTISQGEPP